MKHNIIRSFIVGLAVVMGLASCSNFMETESLSNFTQDDFYTSEGNMDRALIGVYGCLKPFSKYYFVMSDFRSDNMYVRVESKQNQYADCSQLNTSGLLNDDIIYSCWSDHYSLIVSANQLIDNIGNVTFTKAEAPKQMGAEARFLRALSYFDLVRFYGNVPVSLHTVTIDESFALGQSTPEQVYLQAILPDFYYAANNLMETAQDYTGTARSERVKRIAAKAMLAKAYLQMAGYPIQATSATFSVEGINTAVTIPDLKAEAKRLLSEVITEAGDGYWAETADDWNRMFLHENDNKYYLFEIQYALAVDQGNPMTPLSKSQVTSADAFTGANLTAGPHVYVDRKDILPHFMTLDATGKDYLDKRAFSSINTYGDGTVEDESGETINEGDIWTPKFLEHKKKREHFGMSPMDDQIVTRTYWPQNYPIVRLEDVMLLYAELAGSSDSKAVGYLNKIRSRAGLPGYTGDFQEAVKMERRYELFAEGQRWFDEVRQNTYVSDLKARWRDCATRMGNEMYATYANRVNVNSLYYPIPISQIRVKEDLYKQNPGY